MSKHYPSISSKEYASLSTCIAFQIFFRVARQVSGVVFKALLRSFGILFTSDSFSKVNCRFQFFIAEAQFFLVPTQFQLFSWNNCANSSTIVTHCPLSSTAEQQRMGCASTKLCECSLKPRVRNFQPDTGKHTLLENPQMTEDY